ncbi:hypothetical protein B0H66DRAFT_622967, partial [Apodospora peruviana]
MFLATFLWGFTIAIACFSFAKAVRQTHRSWRRSSRANAYIVMVWLEWTSCVVTAITSWLFLENLIAARCVLTIDHRLVVPSFVQCLMQIMTNRIALIMYDPVRAAKLKWIVIVAIGIINVSVFCIWVPARLQISSTYIQANQIWDRAEKCIFLVIDAALNSYFMYLIKSKLVANGLKKYCLVYRFNLVMVCLSISLDVSIITHIPVSLSSFRYVQLHPAAYLIKLHIEMNIAELLGKVLMRSSNRRVNSLGSSRSTDNSAAPRPPPLMVNHLDGTSAPASLVVGPPTPGPRPSNSGTASEAFTPKWQAVAKEAAAKAKRIYPVRSASGGIMTRLDLELLDD